MLAVRLSDETERRLEVLAERTGRTKTFYAREAIEAHLDDLEDFYLAEERLRVAWRAGLASGDAEPAPADWADQVIARGEARRAAVRATP